MRNQTLFASLALAMLSACVGGIDMPGGGGGGGGDDGSGSTPTARAQFNSSVFPLLQSKCASCHVGPETTATNMFLGTGQTTDSFYAGITNDEAINGNYNPASANLLLKGAHEGPAWLPAESQTIASWLTAEATARNIDTTSGGGGSGTTGSGGTTGPAANTTARGAEMQWAACLSVSTTEYTTTKAYAIADMQSDNGRCYSCHEPGGAGGAYWGKLNNYLTMLQKWQMEIFITGAFEAEAQNTSPVSYKMAVAQEKICDKGQEQNNNQGTHPPFDCNQTVDGVKALDALASFTTMVQAKLDAGGCPTPAFYTGTGSGSGSGSGTPTN